MPNAPSPAESAAACYSLSSRHFLLPDENPAEFERHAAMWLRAWVPRDPHERQAADAAIRCMWREERADRLEALVLTDLFAAGRLPDPAEAEAAKSAAFKALGTLLRYRARIEREQRAAMQALETLRQRRLAPAERPSEPERAQPGAVPVLPPGPAAAMSSPAAGVEDTLPSEPEPARRLNRHQRRAMAAIDRRAA